MHTGALPSNVVMLYAPRDAEERDVTLSLLRAAYEFARGNAPHEPAATPLPGSSQPHDPRITMTTTTTTTLTDTSDMLLLHRMFRREFARTPSLVRQAAGSRERAAIVGPYALEMLGLLHVHHHGEDELLYPLLQERVSLQHASCSTGWTHSTGS